MLAQRKASTYLATFESCACVCACIYIDQFIIKGYEKDTDEYPDRRDALGKLCGEGHRENTRWREVRLRQAWDVQCLQL